MNENRTLTFDTKGRLIKGSNPFLVFRLSWVAYVRETWVFLLRLLLCVLVAAVISWGLERFAKLPDMAWLTLAGVAVAIAWTVYSIALTRSVLLFIDENGVWLQAGIFPWEKGISGMPWRDIGQAGYTQGFMSWALRSYHIRISHRFTTGTEVYLRNVHHGNLVVEHINGVMTQIQRRVMST